MLSEDQGASWRQVPTPVSVTLTTVRFADPAHGVAVGHGGVVLTTRDGGQSWQLKLDGRRAAEIALQAAADDQSQADARRLVDDGPDKPFLDVLLWDARRMLVVGAYGLAFYSEDGGESWDAWMHRIPNPGGFHWYVARRHGDTIVLAGEQGVMAGSMDGGQRFETLTSPYRGSWFAGEFAGDGSLVLAGLRGNLWRSTDLGATWSSLPVPLPASLIGGAVGANGEPVFVNQAGYLVQVGMGAVTVLNKTPVPMPVALLPLGAQGGTAYLVVGMTGAQVLRTESGQGRTGP